VYRFVVHLGRHVHGDHRVDCRVQIRKRSQTGRRPRQARRSRKLRAAVGHFKNAQNPNTGNGVVDGEGKRI